MIRLYRAHWSTNCERVALALAHKVLNVESVVIDYSDRSVVERVSGQPLVPVIEDGDEVVHDSTAILRHLERRFGGPRLFPTDPRGTGEMDVFLSWFNEVWKSAPNAVAAEMEKTEPDRGAIESAAASLAGWLDTFERLLDGREFLMGERLSAADCAAFPFLKYACRRDPADDELFHRILEEHQTIEDRPRLAAWIDRVDALPRAYGPTVAEHGRSGP